MPLCKRKGCGKTFETVKKTQHLYCCRRCRWNDNREDRGSDVPEIDPRQRARQIRQCREMLLEGYDATAILERFEGTVYEEVRASLTPDEKAYRYRVAFNGAHHPRRSHRQDNSSQAG